MAKVHAIRDDLSGEMGGRIEYKKITPDVARALIDRGGKNRRLMPKHVSRLADEMRGGRWRVNAQTIVFNKKGEVIDGLHRLHACTDAGVSFETLVAYDLDDDAFETIDDGKQRKLSHALYVKGVSSADCIAGALSILWHYEHGTLTYNTVSPTDPGGASKTQLLGFFKSMKPEDWENSARQAYRCAKFCGPSIGTACHYIFRKINKSDAEHFFEVVATGAGLNQKDPILALRDRLYRMKFEARAGQRRPKRGVHIALFFKAWNAYRAGKTVSGFAINPDVPFPTPK